jgi:lysophospholipase L1-like esterase
MSPLRIFLFLSFVFICVLAVATLKGRENVEILNGYFFKIPSNPFLFYKENKADEKVIKNIIKSSELLDSLHIKNDSLTVINDEQSAVSLNLNLQYKSQDCLKTLFHALKNESGQTAVHVLHYGDSQIESDRITDYLRMKLQNQFGGRGPGLIGLKPLTNGIGCKVFAGDEWERHVTFLGKNKDVPHYCFGPAAILYRFTSYMLNPDSAPLKSARVAWQVNALAGKNMTGFNKIKILYGGGKRKIWMEYYENGILSHADSLNYGSCTLSKEFAVHPNSNQQEIRFYGKYSPDFYGMSLESENGVYVDNIAQRGSSGTFFHLVNTEQLKYYYQLLNVKCILMQFGGNALPNLKNEEQVKNYASFIRGQLGILKKIAPNTSVIFIGPADMGVKEGTDFVTHPLLETLRDELKKAVMESGMAYFDMYDCMGGKNSMQVWVKEGLAADDYIHFSPSGARKIAVLLHTAIMNEYQKWIKSGK